MYDKISNGKWNGLQGLLVMRFVLLYDFHRRLRNLAFEVIVASASAQENCFDLFFHPLITVKFPPKTLIGQQQNSITTRRSTSTAHAHAHFKTVFHSISSFRFRDFMDVSINIEVRGKRILLQSANINTNYSIIHSYP